MSFDRRAHRGYQLAHPIYAHSNACAVGNGPSIALAQGYAFGQTQARLIGTQTYRLHLDTPGLYSDNEAEIGATTWSSVSRHRRYVPAHAEHVFVEAWFSVLGSQSAAVYMRVRADDGVTNEISASVVQIVEPNPTFRALYGSDASRAAANFNLYGSARTSGYDGNNMILMRDRVTLSNLTLAQQIQVTIEAYAVDADTESVALRLHPWQTQAWWEVTGG